MPSDDQRKKSKPLPVIDLCRLLGPNFRARPSITNASARPSSGDAVNRNNPDDGSDHDRKNLIVYKAATNVVRQSRAKASSKRAVDTHRKRLAHTGSSLYDELFGNRSASEGEDSPDKCLSMDVSPKPSSVASFQQSPAPPQGGARFVTPAKRSIDKASDNQVGHERESVTDIQRGLSMPPSARKGKGRSPSQRPVILSPNGPAYPVHPHPGYSGYPYPHYGYGAYYPPPLPYYPPVYFPPPSHHPSHLPMYPPLPVKNGKGEAKRSAKRQPEGKRPAKKARKSPSKTARKKSKVASKTADPQTRKAAIQAVNEASGGKNDRAAELAAAIMHGITMRPSGKWQAQLYFAGKSRYIGVFDTREKAALAYEIAREKLDPEKIPTNNDVNAADQVVNLARKAAFEGVNEKDRKEKSKVAVPVDQQKTKAASSRKDNRDGGVTMRPSGKWQADLYYAGYSRYIGVFDTREKAALAYEMAREMLKTHENPTDNSVKGLIETEKAIKSARKAALKVVKEKYPEIQNEGDP